MKLISMKHTLPSLSVSSFRNLCLAAAKFAKPLLFCRFRYLPILVLTSGLTQPLQAADIALKVENITELSGTLFWSVFDDEDSYKSEQTPLVAGRSKVTASSLKLTLHELPAGEYAVKLFHDANDNGEMDTNLIGLPQEGYGFSNNAGSFGPASFSDAKVIVSENTQITIRLR